MDGAKSVADGKGADGGDDDNPSLESGTESEPKSKSEPDPDPDTSDPEASPTGPKTDDITTSSDAPGAVRSTGETSHQHRLEELLDQLEAVSERLETAMEDPSPANAASEAEDSGADPQLAHKAIHACMNSQHISEEDELEIIRRLT